MVAAGWLSTLVNAIVALVVAAQSMAVTEPAQYGPNAPLTAEHLRKGGFVIFFRHATADQGTDATPFDPDDCATQRNLGDKGRQEARAIGEGFRAQRIPLGAVQSSEFCRARETAQLAFARAEAARPLNLCCQDGRNLRAEEREEFLQRALAARPRPGTNTVLVGHSAFMMTDLAMGEAAVYAPDGRGGAVRVGRVLPSEWANDAYRPGEQAPGTPGLAPSR